MFKCMLGCICICVHIRGIWEFSVIVLQLFYKFEIVSNLKLNSFTTPITHPFKKVENI